MNEKLIQKESLAEDVPINERLMGAESEIDEKLSGFFENIEIGKYGQSTRKFITVALESVEDYMQAIQLLNLIGIEPWPDKEKLSLTVDNRFDIESLFERGIISFSDLSRDEKNILEDISDHEILLQTFPVFEFPELQSIPDLFARRGGSRADDLTETPEGVRERHEYATATYVYSVYKKKYRREPGGRVFRRKSHGTEEEILEQQQIDLLRSAQEGNVQARDEFITMNVGLVYFVALNMSRMFPMVDPADLIQEALIELNHCIDKYVFPDGENEEKTSWGKAKFSTYAVISMRWNVFNYIKDTLSSVRIPRYASEHFSKIEKLEDGRHGVRIDREAAIQQIQKLLDVGPDVAKELLEHKEMVWQAEYVDIDDISDKDEGEFMRDESDPQELHDVVEAGKIVADVLDLALPERQAMVIRMRYGIDTPKLTYEEIGEITGTGKGQVQRIEGDALRRLRHPKHIKLSSWIRSL